MSDFVTTYTQIKSYPDSAWAQATDAVLLQRDGLGGPYVSMQAGTFAASALSEYPGALTLHGPLGIGYAPPADAWNAQIFAGGHVMPTDGVIYWNQYSDGTIAHYWMAGGAAQIWWDPTAGVTTQLFAPGAADAPLGPATGWTELWPNGMLNVSNQITVSRGPQAPLEVATMAWVQQFVLTGEAEIHFLDGPLGIGYAPPADASAAQIFAAGYVMPTDGVIYWNQYNAGGVARYWAAGGAAQIWWDPTAGVVTQLFAPGAADAPLATATGGTELWPNGMLNVSNQVTVSRDPVAALEVATKQYVDSLAFDASATLKFVYGPLGIGYAAPADAWNAQIFAGGHVMPTDGVIYWNQYSDGTVAHYWTAGGAAQIWWDPTLGIVATIYAPGAADAAVDGITGQTELWPNGMLNVSNQITVSRDPQAPLEVASKQYVDAQMIPGITQLTGDVSTVSGSGVQTATVMRLRNTNLAANLSANVGQVLGWNGYAWAPQDPNLGGTAAAVSWGSITGNIANQADLAAALAGAGGTAATWGSITGNIGNQADLQTALGGKQATLVSGSSIKTINSQSLLGSGNIDITAGGGGISTIVAGAGLTGGTITTSGTIALATPVSLANGGTGQSAASNSALLTALGAQATLVSGTSIKTINSQSLLGGGNIDITSSAGGLTSIIAGTGLTGGTITTSGSTIALATPVSLANGGTGQSAASNSALLTALGAQPAGSYITGNQSITLSGDVTGSGATAITATVARIRGRNVNTATPVINDVLAYDGTNWGPAQISGGVDWPLLDTANAGRPTPPSGTRLQLASADGSPTVAVLNAAQNPANITLRRSQGTLGNPQALGNSSNISTIAIQGHDGSTYGGGAEIGVVTTGAWSGASRPARMSFSITRVGGTTPQIALQLGGSQTQGQDGGVVVGPLTDKGFGSINCQQIFINGIDLTSWISSTFGIDPA